MRKLLLIVSIAFLCNLNILGSYQTDNPSKALIFVIDVSSSMRNPRGFFDKVKREIKDYIREKVEIGDIVTIYSFGDNVSIVSDVENYRIKNTQDIENLMHKITLLKAKDKHTWMSKAVDIMANNMSNLRKLYKNIRIKAFIFTDGKNDPPPGEESLTLKEILSRHETEFKQEKSFVYYVTFGIKAPSEINEAAGINVVESPKRGEIELSEIDFEPLIFNITKDFSESITLNLKFHIRSLNKINVEKLKFELYPTKLNVTPDKFEKQISKNDKEFDVKLKVNKIPKPGNYQIKYKIKARKGVSTPEEFTINLLLSKEIVKINNDEIKLEGALGDKELTFTLNGNNLTKHDIVLSVFTNVDSLSITPNEIKVKPGEFEAGLTLKTANLGLGKHSANIIIRPTNNNIKVEGEPKLTVEIYEPFNWSGLLTTILIIVLLIVLAALVYFVCAKILPKFGIDSTITFYSQASQDGPIYLSDYNKFCLSSVTVGYNGDINFDDDILFKLKPTKAGIKLKMLEGSIFYDVNNYNIKILNDNDENNEENNEISVGNEIEITGETRFETLNKNKVEIKLVNIEES